MEYETVRCSFRGQANRDVTPVVGRLYRVEPMSPAKRKHRGRVGVLLSLPDMKESSVAFRFCDNNRVGRVDVCDLVEVEEQAARDVP